jgi:hypothetical protein
MSTSFERIASRSFMFGNRECPPASNFAPSSACSAEIAASTASTRSYSKAAGIIVPLLRLLDRPPHAFG